MKGEEIMSEGRILAVKIDGKLFDKIDELVEQEGITKQKYMTDLISKDISQRMQQQAAQQKELEIKLTDGQKVWDRAEVMDAIVSRLGEAPFSLFNIFIIWIMLKQYVIC